MREDWFILGPLAHLPNVRRDALLRQLAKSSRQQTRARKRASGHRLCSTRGTLAVLLSWRCAWRILSISRSSPESGHPTSEKRWIGHHDLLQNSRL